MNMGISVGVCADRGMGGVHIIVGSMVGRGGMGMSVGLSAGVTVCTGAGVHVSTGPLVLGAGVGVWGEVSVIRGVHVGGGE